MNGINKPGIQFPGNQKQAAKNNNISKGADFQSALESARNKKKDRTALAASPVPTPVPSVNTSNEAPASSGGGFASSSQSNASVGLRGHQSRGPGFRDDGTEQKVEQQLNNQLIQSGLQAQTLKSEPASTREND